MKKILYSITSFLIMLSCSHSEGEKNLSEKQKEETYEEAATTIIIKEKQDMYPELTAYIGKLVEEFDQIPEERKEILSEMAEYVSQKKSKNEESNLIFICTHNSRRSHLSQIWSITAAHYYGIQENIYTYSGGTESTAFNPRAVAALERAGFSISSTQENNPHYTVKFSDGINGQECFSKKYDNPYNPRENFMAVMTCSEADEACPIVRGASARISLPYIDPKVSDGTELEQKTYDERSRQIAIEMFYAMSLISA